MFFLWDTKGEFLKNILATLWNIMKVNGRGCQAVKWQQQKKHHPFIIKVAHITHCLCDEQIRIYIIIHWKSLLGLLTRVHEKSSNVLFVNQLFFWVRSFKWISWSNKKLSEWFIHESECSDCTDTDYEDCQRISTYILVCSSLLGRWTN